MIFASPLLALAALGAALIPILLHLFLRRPKITPWGSNFLLQIALAKIQRRRKFEKWILLLLRVLAVALVGFAAAGPVAKSLMQKEKTIDRWIILDDGAASAEIKVSGLNVLEEMKQNIIKSINNQGAGDRFAIVLASTPARVLIEPTTNHEAVIQALSKIVCKEVPSDIPAALEKAFPQLENKLIPRQVEVWSGFRHGSVNLEIALPTNLINRAEQVTLITTKPLENQSQNQALWKCSVIRSSGETEDANQRLIKVQIRREGPSPSGANQVLFQNARNEMVAKSDQVWNEAATEKEFEVQVALENGTQQGVQATIQEDAQPLDNKIFLSFDAQDNSKVTVLGRKSLEQNIEKLPAENWILRAIESTGTSVQEMDAETISIRPPLASDTIILTRPDLVDQAGWSWLQNFSKEGGVLVITPAAEIVEQNWAVDIERLLQIPIRSQKEIMIGEYRLATKQPRTGPLSLLGAELDVLSEPIHVAKYLPLETTDAAAQSSLLLENGKPIMCWAKPKNGSGIIVILAVAPVLSWSDLPMKPLMVPLFQELVRGGRMIASEQQEIQTGSTPSFGSQAAGGLFVPPPQSGATTIELDQSGQSQNRVLVPGLWTLQKRNTQTKTFAVNLAPAAASIQPLMAGAVKSWFATVKPILFQDEKPDSNQDNSWSVADPAISGILFLLALACAVIECFLSRSGSPRPLQQPQTVGA